MLLDVRVNWPLILDYLRVLIWPVVVGTFLGYFLRRFGSHIGPLLDRIRSVKALGTEVGFADPRQEEALGDEEAAEETVVDEAELLTEKVEEYERLLGEQHLAAQEERARLLRQLAAAQLGRDFERIYRVIYGSQIAALRSLNATEDGVPQIALEAHLNQSKATWTTMPFIQSLTFEQWMGFLLRNGLAIHPEPPNGPYKITSKGSGFLGYIEAGRYPSKVF
ncbi:MAG: hypothetical protein M3540_12845 [Actinomycetota bacterium]|nr:hypothetical protein [Actinomycetota bacterium]